MALDPVLRLAEDGPLREAGKNNIDTPALGDMVASKTESAREAEIDAANGLRHHGGRRPVPEDFEDILTPAGNSGDIVGSEVSDNPYIFGETGSTGGTL